MERVDFTEKVVGIFTDDIEGNIVVIDNLSSLDEAPDNLLIADLHLDSKTLHQLEEEYIEIIEQALDNFMLGEICRVEMIVNLDEADWINYTTKTLGQLRKEIKENRRQRRANRIKNPTTLQEKWQVSVPYREIQQ